MDKIVTLPVFNVVSVSPGELFSIDNAHGDRGLAETLMTLEAEWETISYLLMRHTSLSCMKKTSWMNAFGVHFEQIWGIACSSVHICPSSSLLQTSLSLLPFFPLMFFICTSLSPPPSDTESLMCPCCVEELFWASSPLAGCVWVLPLDKTQKPGANPAVQPKRPTKSPSTMTQLRATSLNHINQLWCEIEMRVGGKVRKEDGGKERKWEMRKGCRKSKYGVWLE